jgi:plastocyanin
MRSGFAQIGLVAGLGVLTALLPASGGAKEPIVHRIVIGKMAFGPSPPGLHEGDTIEWVNEDIFVHSVTAADKSFDVDIEPEKTARVIVKNAGTIRYVCKYHPSMQAQLVVEAAK